MTSWLVLRSGKITLLLASLVTALAAQHVDAQSITQNAYASITPASVPVGDPLVGAADFRFRASGVDICLSSLTVTQIGTIADGDINKVEVWYDGGNGVFDHAGTPVDDTVYHTGGPYTLAAGSVTIPLDTSVTIDSAGWERLFVSVDVDSAASTTVTVGAEITDIVFGTNLGVCTGGTGSPYDPTPAHGTAQPVDTYEVTLSATGSAPATADQGDQDIEIIEIVLTALDNNWSADIDLIRLHRIGSAGSVDTDVASVKLFEDTNGNSTFDGTAGGDTELATASTFAPANYISLNPTANIVVDNSGQRLFAVLDLALAATAGEDVGLEVETPSATADVLFLDTDPDTGLANVEYDQTGFITSGVTTPATGNLVTITTATLDTDPPTVSSTLPADGATDGDVDDPIRIFFNEPSGIDGTTVTFTLTDSASATVSGSTLTSGSIVTFTPDDLLEFQETYTGDLAANFADLAGNVQTSPFSFSFTTAAQVTIPNLEDPVVFNNRITPGSTDPVRIGIPEPPSGPNDRVTVRVYTATGKRVATLVNGVAYQNITQPLIWNGTNGIGEQLAPGLYFVHVRATGYSQSLEVLIIR